VETGGTARIDRIQTWACSIELPTPLDFGSYRLTSRQYVGVRITTADGLVAETSGLSRRLPVDVHIQDLYAPQLIGRSALDIGALTREIVTEQPAVEVVGAAAYAWSLLDICLWDLRAQAFGVPLWRLLGGDPRPVPVQLVEGYELPGEDDAAFAERIAARQAEGYRAIKIEGASAPTPQHTERRLAAVRRAAGDDLELIVDLGWRHATAEAAARDIRQWAHLRPAWVEDSLPRDRVAEAIRLRRLVDVPLGAGDEITRAGELPELLAAGALDVARLDATTMGGISALIGLAARVSAAGRRASPHMHPEIHLHCVLGLPASEYVEAFPIDRSFDLEHRLLKHPVLDGVRAGHLEPPDEPGIGLRLDPDAIEHFAYRRLDSR
jgi:L-alanine-DL-glutamate epimerase-like enolase superfamily enzyme